MRDNDFTESPPENQAVAISRLRLPLSNRSDRLTSLNFNQSDLQDYPRDRCCGWKVAVTQDFTKSPRLKARLARGLPSTASSNKQRWRRYLNSEEPNT